MPGLMGGTPRPGQSTPVGGKVHRRQPEAVLCCSVQRVSDELHMEVKEVKRAGLPLLVLLWGEKYEQVLELVTARSRKRKCEGL